MVGAGTEVVVDRAGAAGCRSGKLVCEATGAGARGGRARRRGPRPPPLPRPPLSPGAAGPATAGNGPLCPPRPPWALPAGWEPTATSAAGGRARRRGRPAPSLRERSRRVAGDNVLEVKDLGLDDGHGPGRGAVTGAHRRHPGQGGVFAVPVPTLAWWRGRAAPPNPGESHGPRSPVRSPRRPVPPPTDRGGKGAGTAMSARDRAG